MKLLLMVNTRTRRDYMVLAKDAHRAKMLICLGDVNVRMSEFKVSRQYDMDNKTERVIAQG
jgi:hypothetical protein